MFDSTRGTFRSPASAAVAAKADPPKARLIGVRLDRLRHEMDQLDLDERHLAFWSAMSERSIHAILESGTATRISLLRMRRGLCWKWTDQVGIGPDLEHIARISFAYLTVQQGADEA